MEKKEKAPQIKIETNLNNHTVVKIGDVALDSEALMLLDGLQEDLGEHYRTVLRRVSDILIENSEDINIEYGETMRLLQVLGQLRADLRTLVWPRTPEAGKTGFDMYLAGEDPDNSRLEAAMEQVAANDAHIDNAVDAGNEDNS